MNVGLQIDTAVDEVSVAIKAPQLTPEVERLYQMVSNYAYEGRPQILIGYKNNQAIPLKLHEIVRLYTEDRQVWAQTAGDVMRVRMRIKELETMLTHQGFVKINQGEIINIAFIKRMDLSMAGSIAVRLSDGSSCFVSRRLLKSFRDAMGL